MGFTDLVINTDWSTPAEYTDRLEHFATNIAAKVKG
jgi:hypothetical protein